MANRSPSPNSSRSATSRLFPVFLPSRDKSTDKRPPRAVAAVVRNRATGHLELRSLSLFPSEVAVSYKPARDSPEKAASSKDLHEFEKTRASNTPRQSVPNPPSATPVLSRTTSSLPELPAARPSNLDVTYKQPYGPSNKESRESLVHRTRSPLLLSDRKGNLLISPQGTARRRYLSFRRWLVCLIGSCCFLIAVSVVGMAWYLLQATGEGRQALQNIKDLFHIRTRSSVSPRNDDSARRGAETQTDVIREELPYRTKSGVIHSSTRGVVPSCKHVLCEYHASRWSVSVAFHPCDDFYSYVCGNWSQLGSNESATFETDQNKEIEITLHALLWSETRPKGRRNIAYSLYDSCQEKVSYTDSKLFLGSLLQRVKLGKWPSKNSLLSRKQMWDIHARIYRMLGVSPLVSVTLERDPKNVSRTIICLGPPHLIVRSANYVGIPSWFLPSLYRVTSIFDSEFYEDVSQKLLQFVVKLEGLHSRHEEKFRSTTLGSHRPYAALLMYTLDGIQQVRSSTPLLLKSQSYLKLLWAFLNSTKSSSVYNYLGFRVLAHMSPLLSEEFSTIGRLRMTWLTGRWQTDWPLWQKCIWFIDDMNPRLLFSVYSEYAWPHLRPYNVDFQVQKLKQVFAKHLERIEACSGKKHPKCLELVNSTSLVVVDPADMDLKPIFVNVSSGYFLEEYVIFKRRAVQCSLTSCPSSLTSLLSVFARSPVFGSDAKTLYLPIASFFEVFHNRDYQLLLRNVQFLYEVYWMLLDKLRVDLSFSLQQTQCSRHRLRRSGTGESIERLVQDVAAWELTAAYFCESDWNKRVQIGGLSKDRNIFVLAAMAKCRNPVSESLPTGLTPQPRFPNLITELFSNSKMFGDVWSCNKGSFMNPSEKCTIWKY